MPKVTCPCCKGERVLVVFDEEYGEVIHMVCMHCEGTGQVDAEVEEDGSLIRHGNRDTQGIHTSLHRATGTIGPGRPSEHTGE